MFEVQICKQWFICNSMIIWWGYYFRCNRDNMTFHFFKISQTFPLLHCVPRHSLSEGNKFGN